jgi:hypothetical protein
VTKKKKIVKRQPRRSIEKATPTPTTDISVHPWRVCPYGEHQVITHPRRNPPSKTHPAGSVSTVHWHCAHNPSGKDQLYPDEIREIATQHFSNLKNKPCSLPLDFGAAGSQYDDLIAGWVQYWNEVLKPDVPLDPNLVKALIASESSFDPTLLANPDKSDSARGLTQITNDTRKILGNAKGELKDHLITATKTDLNDPGVNICAGVRWLFQKRKLASIHLKRPASWIDAVWEYKGTAKKTKEASKKIVTIFNGFYEDYQKCAKA